MRWGFLWEWVEVLWLWLMRVGSSVEVVGVGGVDVGDVDDGVFIVGLGEVCLVIWFGIEVVGRKCFELVVGVGWVVVELLGIGYYDCGVVVVMGMGCNGCMWRNLQCDCVGFGCFGVVEQYGSVDFGYIGGFCVCVIFCQCCDVCGGEFELVIVGICCCDQWCDQLCDDQVFVVIVDFVEYV